ncbi:MAG: hypothetical protein BGO47_06685 [Microbacterium sp. 67-17]|nr:MAG: hypothetical protein BGO47_06685 [Microbacterium sp. 67-17]
MAALLQEFERVSLLEDTARGRSNPTPIPDAGGSRSLPPEPTMKAGQLIAARPSSPFGETTV